jgi:hypothetical protein
MHGGQYSPHADRGRELQHLPTLLGDPKRSSQKGPGGDGAQAHDQCRVDKAQLCFQPGTAGLDVGDLGCGVNSPLAPLGKTKMLDCIRDVDLIPGHFRFAQSILKQPSSRPNKRNAFAIFDVAGLFSDERQGCPGVACGENHLGGRLPQLAAPAILRRSLELLDVGALRHPWCSRLRHVVLVPVPDRAGPCPGLVVVLPPFKLDHMDYGVDQCQMGEGLREVSKLLAGVRIDLLAVQVEFTCE